MNLSDLQFLGETDSLVPNGDEKRKVSFTWGLGAGYQWAIENVNLLHDVSIGMDLFYFKTTQHGDVLQFQLPIFNNLTYALPITSIRLMLDSEWTLCPINRRYFPFIEAGIGFVSNEASYIDTPRPSSGSVSARLSSETRHQFTYALGGGVRILLLKNLNLSFRYLYTDLGNATTSKTGNITIVAPLTISLSTQVWLVGLTYLF